MREQERRLNFIQRRPAIEKFSALVYNLNRKLTDKSGLMEENMITPKFAVFTILSFLVYIMSNGELICSRSCTAANCQER